MAQFTEMKILYVATDDISLLDIPEALNALGYEVYQLNEVIHAQGFWRQECEKLQRAIEAMEITHVVTYDFIESVAEACHCMNCIYLAWVYDAPQKELYTEYARYSTNYIFVFDRNEYERLKKIGIRNIYHFPLAVCTDKVAMVLENDFENKLEQYTDEISFVGQLYQVEHLSEIMAGAGERVKNEFEACVDRVTLQWSGNADFYGSVPQEVIDYLGDYEGHKVKREYPYMDERFFYGAAVVARVIANRERVAILNALGSKYPVSLYTRDADVSALAESVTVKPGVGFDREVYGVYQKSKINLNITLHCIETGIPQRVFDVMAAGGFLITNYQEELEYYFEVGRDLVVYHNLEELQELVEYYLNHDKEREEIARTGQEKVWRMHNYNVRMMEVMKIVTTTEMEKSHKTLILTTPTDYKRLAHNHVRMVQNLYPRKLYFLGSEEVGELVKASAVANEAGFINEETILPFDKVHHVMKEALGVEELPRGITGWYYQQFLKMQYSFVCEEEYYLVWDGDTVPCAPFTMFAADGVSPYFDLKDEYHEEYFNTIGRLFPGMHKAISGSFISEHMLIHCKMMQQMIQEIEGNDSLKGNTFYEKIVFSIPKDKLTSNSFSEFETYGTYMAFRNPAKYRLRKWHSFRYGASFLHPETMTDEDYEWFARDFEAISYEKNQSVREDHENLFQNKEYQRHLSARQMLEIAQEEFQEGMVETW